MVSRSRLSGVYAAVVTPFDRGQRVDLDWMTQHITFVRRAGIHGIVVCGTNGEGQWLSAAERRAIVEHVCTHKKSLRLIAGAGFNSLTETAGFAAFCDDYPVDALLIPPPCFDHAASGAGIVNFYRFVAERTSTPIILYNIPQLTGLPITHEMLRELAKVNNIRGVKDSTGDPASTRAFISAFPRLAVFTGHDDCSLQGLRDGAAGMISGLANVFPSQVEAVLVGRPGLAPHYQLVVTRQGHLDRLRIEVEAQPGVAEDKWGALAADAIHYIKSLIGVSAEIVVQAPGSVPRSQGKAVRVRDLRPKEV